MQTSHADSVYMPLCLSAVFPFHYMQLPQSFQTRSTTSLCYRLKRNSESSLLPWVDVTHDNPVLSSSAPSSFLYRGLFIQYSERGSGTFMHNFALLSKSRRSLVRAASSSPLVQIPKLAWLCTLVSVGKSSSVFVQAMPCT